MRLRSGETEFNVLGEDDLMWVEADMVERVTGMTMVEIGARGQVCGCQHRLSQHRPVNADDDADLVCESCGCDQPQPNVPSVVAQAMLWVSMKRAQPEMSFKDMGLLPAGSFELVEGTPDPTEAVDSTADEPAT